jgi:hypothetical protein
MEEVRFQTWCPKKCQNENILLPNDQISHTLLPPVLANSVTTNVSKIKGVHF